MKHKVRILSLVMAFALLFTGVGASWIVPKDNIVADAANANYYVNAVVVSSAGVSFYSTKSTSGTVVYTTTTANPLCLYCYNTASTDGWYKVQLGPNSSAGAKGYAYVQSSKVSTASYAIDKVWKKNNGSSSSTVYNSPGYREVGSVSARTYMFGYGSSGSYSRVLIETNGIKYLGYIYNLSSSAGYYTVTDLSTTNYALTVGSSGSCTVRKYPYNDEDTNNVYATYSSFPGGSLDTYYSLTTAGGLLWYKVTINGGTYWVKSTDVHLNVNA